jgi:hypothetical protein
MCSLALSLGCELFFTPVMSFFFVTYLCDVWETDTPYIVCKDKISWLKDFPYRKILSTDKNQGHVLSSGTCQMWYIHFTKKKTWFRLSHLENKKGLTKSKDFSHITFWPIDLIKFQGLLTTIDIEKVLL